MPAIRRLILACFVPLGLTAASAPAQTVVATEGAPIELFIGEGKLVRMDSDVGALFLANPAVADVEVKSPRLIYLFGKSVGQTTLFGIDGADAVTLSSRITVTADVEAMARAAQAAVPGQSFRLTASDGAIVIGGSVGSPEDAARVEGIVRDLAGEAAVVVNGLRLDQPMQVNLQVKIAEVSRTVSTDLGVRWDAAFAGGTFTGGRAVEGGYSLTGTALAGGDLRLMIDALRERGLVTILSEPNLTARSGDTATFLAGGRFPYQTTAGDEAQVQFEPFGVELGFTPRVLGPDQIALEVSTKIRELDFQGGSTTEVQTVPLIRERSAATTVEVGSGQSFAVAGLFSSNVQQDIASVPGFGDLPVLGALFRSTRFQRGETELVIIVTPYLVQPTAPGRLKTPLDGSAPAGPARQFLLGDFSIGTETAIGDGTVLSLKGTTGFMLQ